ncbi:PREDICTED: adenylate kinase isoenzyme 5 [Dinoponera quadriceps]|uniref:Adenylate kinase isoenzyme 5 n=1 Tax=Dinoponera quadriceps TaxID=609295 RepID=A0A6P3X2I7_DINQU|nr:PREDICTED: adenylate kinase isoenzyme 5 [Dinoponera quadriceps]XP_014472576.1 PREDICTED: adenylate kinase isoenzyme 5 [Dinoponera quadriceps]XP_014472577.1 PREDICTED: adenylate kinase isoenzyme 5 [Dinoponera quadriceps]XP_014472578.1 PREDICTED: adenylate kinase isoenzyme 5 [Dinoponera quadriceps]XP_014472579.1 PREDICTED: adenylate kinase isoenzyme 5 [Dinoponera quadriceps]
MGICLDTDQQNGSQVFEEGAGARATGRWRGEAGLLATPPDGHFPKQNVGPVKFEIPKVPVIFVLGGPGSGKVTYCDNLIQEKKGITHINMMDLLQQYALGNDMQDFGQLSSKTVTEVLMLEMKMSPGAKVFLVSGYPRNMRDVVEYAEKIKIVNGVILVSWRQEVLERQIDFGAQLGHVIIGLARMELHNFYRNVMPVAEYFDQSGMLLEVNGERNPSEVYVSFRDAVLKILGMSSGEIRDQDIPQSLEAEVEVERRKESISSSPLTKQQIVPSEITSPVVPINGSSKTADKPRKGLPSFIWVIGGPGSNKSALCAQAVHNMTGWLHVSIGGLLRTMASSNMIVNESIVSGEMVPHDLVMQFVEQQILLNRDSDGIVIDGYPRDLNQVQEFESKFGQEPPLVLLDCSKLQLGRGRLDDSVSAFRKRLELFREVSLPMLKTLDSDNRLTIVDGDTDVPSVQQDFAVALYQLMRRARRIEEVDSPMTKGPNDSNGKHTTIDYENERSMPNGVAKQIVNGVSNYVGKDATKNGIITQGTISNGVLKQQNGHQNGIANGTAHILQNGIAHLANGIASSDKNKVAPATRNYLPKDPIRKMYNEVEGYQQNLHM